MTPSGAERDWELVDAGGMGPTGVPPVRAGLSGLVQPN